MKRLFDREDEKTPIERLFFLEQQQNYEAGHHVPAGYIYDVFSILRGVSVSNFFQTAGR